MSRIVMSDNLRTSDMDFHKLRSDRSKLNVGGLLIWPGDMDSRHRDGPYKYRQKEEYLVASLPVVCLQHCDGNYSWEDSCGWPGTPRGTVPPRSR